MKLVSILVQIISFISFQNVSSSNHYEIDIKQTKHPLKPNTGHREVQPHQPNPVWEAVPTPHPAYLLCRGEQCHRWAGWTGKAYWWNLWKLEGLTLKKTGLLTLSYSRGRGFLGSQLRGTKLMKFGTYKGYVDMNRSAKFSILKITAAFKLCKFMDTICIFFKFFMIFYEIFSSFKIV